MKATAPQANYCSEWLGEKRQLLQRYCELIRDAAASML